MVFITATALAYVHQQTELVKLSYSIECREKKLRQMLDRKESLSYNIDNLEDPSRLERILLARNISVSFPKKGHVFSMAQTKDLRDGQAHHTAAIENKISFSGIFEFLGLRAEAQAKER